MKLKERVVPPSIHSPFGLNQIPTIEHLPYLFDGQHPAPKSYAKCQKTKTVKTFKHGKNVVKSCGQ